MAEVLRRAPVDIAPGARADRDTAAAVPSLARLLSGRRRVLCAIEPDETGRRIVARIAATLAGSNARLGVVSAAWFELPVDASACLFPTPLDRRARLVVERQRALDRLVDELRLSEAEVFATAGVPSREILDVARLWNADLVLYARSAGTGLRPRKGRTGPAIAGLGDDGSPRAGTFVDRLLARR